MPGPWRPDKTHHTGDHHEHKGEEMQKAGANLGVPKQTCAACWQAAQGMGSAGSEPGGLTWGGGGPLSPAALGRCWEVTQSRGTAREEARRLMYNPPGGCIIPPDMYNPPGGYITPPGSSDGCRDQVSGSAASSRSFQAQKQR